MSDQTERERLIEQYRKFIGAIEPGKHGNISDLFADFALHVLKEERAKRPIVGTTADGVKVRVGDFIYRHDPKRPDEDLYVAGMTCDTVDSYYSTPEAARAAKETT